MAKSQLFKPPVIDFIINHGGVFPVRRGQHDEEAFITAHTILDRGGMVLMYAEGGRSRTKELGEPKPGLGRLALESGVPVVPVAIHGSEHVREAKRGVLPKVTVQYGEPIALRPGRAPDARAVAGGRRADLRPRARRCTRRSTPAGPARRARAAAAGAPPGRSGNRLSSRGARHARVRRSSARASGRSSPRPSCRPRRSARPSTGNSTLPSASSARAAPPCPRQRARRGDRALRELQVGDLGVRASGVMLAHVLGERAHERGAGGRLAGREQRAGVLRSDVVVQALVVGQREPRRGPSPTSATSRPTWRLKGIACSSPARRLRSPCPVHLHRIRGRER